MDLKTVKKINTRLMVDLQDTTASNSSDISNYKYNSTWTSYSKSKGDRWLILR